VRADVTALLYGTAVESTAQIYSLEELPREKETRHLWQELAAFPAVSVLTFDKKPEIKG